MIPHAGKALLDPYKIIEGIGVKEGARVADMGCGRTGHFIFSMSKVVGDTGMVYAVDIVKDILESIKSRIRSEGYDNVRAVWSDIEQAGRAPIPSHSLDVCLFVNVMFLIKNKKGALQEAKRLLKPSGRLVIIDWQKNLGPLGPTPELMVPPAQMIGTAAAEGWKLVENFPAGSYHYCLIFQQAARH